MVGLRLFRTLEYYFLMFYGKIKLSEIILNYYRNFFINLLNNDKKNPSSLTV